MKKIFVILALLFSSVFSNNYKDCYNNAYVYFIKIAELLFITNTEAIIEGQKLTNQEIRNMISLEGTNEIVRISTNALRQRGYYNAAIYVESILRKEPYMVNDFMSKIYINMSNQTISSIKDGTIKNDEYFRNLMQYLKKSTTQEMQDVVIKLDYRYYN